MVRVGFQFFDGGKKMGLLKRFFGFWGATNVEIPTVTAILTPFLTLICVLTLKIPY
jgi:hypothetical protein